MRRVIKQWNDTRYGMQNHIKSQKRLISQTRARQNKEETQTNQENPTTSAFDWKHMLKMYGIFIGANYISNKMIHPEASLDYGFLNNIIPQFTGICNLFSSSSSSSSTETETTTTITKNPTISTKNLW